MEAGSLVTPSPKLKASHGSQNSHVPDKFRHTVNSEQYDNVLNLHKVNAWP